MIVRGPRPSDNFAQIHNAALADGRLSFKARGILAFLLSRPPGWKTSAERLARSGPDGERAVKSGLKELEALGYLKRSRTHADGSDPDVPAGTWVHNQVITDQPEEVLTDPELDTIGTKRTHGEELDPALDTIGTFCTGAKQPDINNTESNNTYLGAEDVVNPPKVGAQENPGSSRIENSPSPGGATTTPSRKSEGSRDGGGSGLNPKPQSKRWLSEAAWKTAHQQIELQDIMLSLTKYEIRCKERNTQPSNSEWLRWLIDDEQKMRIEERKQAQDASRRKPWFAVAD